jgi:predicted ATPase
MMSTVRRLPTGTVTFLFTDIEGSTRLIEELGEERYVEALAEHRGLLRQAFCAHGGVEVDTQGDAFLYAFPDPAEALAGAVEGQDALASGPVKVRIGLHTGEPHLTGEGYAGKELHRAARIAATGHGGQVVVSETTQALVDGELSELGEHRLKDFDEPIALFQLGTQRFPPLKTISNTNLPRPVSSFVGRQREVGELVAMLSDGARLLTLSGPGGSGKTRLAIEAASELVPAFKAGVFWIGLAPVRDPALVTDELAQTLGANVGLAEHVAERELLLLLDNFEQVVEAAPRLGELLEACPNLKLLVTSRELLRVNGEVEYPVPPLQQPEAIELFCERSRLRSDETIAELCRRLDDLPLAIELAAARTSVLSPAQILERLSQRLDLLKGGRDVEARQQTLRATIEWSHDLLDEEEKRLFARLAVFRGGCTLEAAEHVAEADLDTLQSLVDKSLVRHSEERFWMLETIREYSWECLVESGAEPELRRRHAEHFVALAERLWQEEETSGPIAEYVDQQASDDDNFTSALEWARDRDESEVLLRLVAALVHYWRIRGFTCHRTWVPLALERGSAPPEAYRELLRDAAWQKFYAGDLEGAAAVTAELRRRADEAKHTQHVMQAMTLSAAIAGETGDAATARRRLLEVRHLALEVGDRSAEVSSTINLGALALRRGDFGAAVEDSAAAVELCRELSREGALNETFVGAASLNLGWSALGLGDYDLAIDSFRQGLTVSQRIGSVGRIANGAEGVAAALIARHEAERGAELLGAAAAIRREFGLGRDDNQEQQIHERAVTDAREALGEEAFAAAWARGEAMTPEEIVAFCGASSEANNG